MDGPKILILIGLLSFGAGLLWFVLDRLGLSAGRLPGDIVIKRDNLRIYVPIVTSVVVSIVLTLFFWLFRR